MKFAQVLWPKHPWNLVLTVFASLALLFFFVVVSHVWPWSPSRGLGLAFGIVAAAVFVFEMLYPFRRPKARPLSRAKVWIQAHIYLGVLAFVAVLIHAGLNFPRGTLGWALLLLSLWTTGSGLLGVWFQKWIPASLSDGLRVEALYERIPELIAGLVEEADALMAGETEVLDRFYRTEVRPLLVRVRPSYSYVFDVKAGRDRALEPFRRISQFVGEGEKDKIEGLMNLFTEKIELDAQYSLQGILRGWLVLHVPTAGLLMGLLALHIFGWVWY